MNNLKSYHPHHPYYDIWPGTSAKPK